MKNRLGLLCWAAATLCWASVAHAQHSYPPIAGPSGGVTTTWSGGYNLGTAPAGTYSSYLIITDWGPSSAANNQWSSEARAALHGAPLGAAPGMGTTGPMNSGTVHIATGAAFGSATNINAVPNMFWFGNLSIPFDSTGANNLYLSHRQIFNAAGDVTWQNMRVVLNPNVTNNRTVNGIAAPVNFTDLGTFQVGNTNLSLAVDNPNTGAAGFSWFRFQVDANVDITNAFDIFTSGGALGETDPRLTLFRNSATGLIPVASTDDMAVTLQAGLTFGSSDTAGFNRPDYDAISPGWFNGRGGTLALANLQGLGYFSGVAGAATLSDSFEYFLAVSFWSGTAPSATLVGGGTFLDGDELGVTLTGTVNIGLGNPGTAMGIGNVTLNFRSIPEPTTLLTCGVGLSGAALFGWKRHRRKKSRKKS